MERPWVVHDQEFGQAALPTGPWDLDFTNDGRLLACAVGVRGSLRTPHIQVLRVTDGESAAQRRHSGHDGRGVVFLDGGSSLAFIAQSVDSVCVKLYRTPLDDLSSLDLTELRVYPPFVRIHGMVRDRAARHFAVLGSLLEICDGATGEPRHVLPVAEGGQEIRAAFSADGQRLYAYGTVQNAVVCYDVDTAEEVRRWPAPAPFGGQVLVTPDERFLLATGGYHHGVYLYDLVAGRRLYTDADGIFRFDRERTLGPWVVSADSRTLAVLLGSLWRFSLPGLRSTHSEEWVDATRSLRGWQVASAWEAPVVAFGVEKESRVLWFRLPS